MAGGRNRLRTVALVAVVVAGVSACGGEDTAAENPRILEAGQIDIELPEGFEVSEGTVIVPPATEPPPTVTEAAGTAAELADGPGTTVAGGAPTSEEPVTTDSTIPLNDTSDPTTDFFVAFNDFRSCLEDEGTTFLGVPDANNPNSPTNDPAYIDSLSLCAARSNILEALQSAQAAQADQTPEEIEESNQQYLAWRECMIGRGWTIPEPVPDADGRLFSFGGQQQTAGAQFEPPPGQDLFTSSDLTECAAEVGREQGDG